MAFLDSVVPIEKKPDGRVILWTWIRSYLVTSERKEAQLRYFYKISGLLGPVLGVAAVHVARRDWRWAVGCLVFGLTILQLTQHFLLRDLPRLPERLTWSRNIERLARTRSVTTLKRMEAICLVFALTFGLSPLLLLLGSRNWYLVITAVAVAVFFGLSAEMFAEAIALKDNAG